MFIEGVSKEKNPHIRAECAAGLAKMGPQTFRSLLLALSDSNQLVKDAVSNAILENLLVEEVAVEFEEDPHLKQTVICSVQELILNNNPDSQTFLG